MSVTLSGLPTVGWGNVPQPFTARDPFGPMAIGYSGVAADIESIVGGGGWGWSLQGLPTVGGCVGGRAVNGLPSVGRVSVRGLPTVGMPGMNGMPTVGAVSVRGLPTVGMVGMSGLPSIGAACDYAGGIVYQHDGESDAAFAARRAGCNAETQAAAKEAAPAWYEDLLKGVTTSYVQIETAKYARDQGVPLQQPPAPTTTTQKVAAGVGTVGIIAAIAAAALLMKKRSR